MCLCIALVCIHPLCACSMHLLYPLALFTRSMRSLCMLALCTRSTHTHSIYALSYKYMAHSYDACTVFIQCMHIMHTLRSNYACTVSVNSEIALLCIHRLCACSMHSLYPLALFARSMRSLYMLALCTRSTHTLLLAMRAMQIMHAQYPCHSHRHHCRHPYHTLHAHS